MPKYKVATRREESLAFRAKCPALFESHVSFYICKYPYVNGYVFVNKADDGGQLEMD